MKSLKRQVLPRTLKVSATEVCNWVIAAGFLAYFFYRSAWAFFPMLLPAGVYILWEQKKNENQKNRRLLQQFGECILSVASSVKTGYAAENAFLESMKDMEMMYGEGAEILEELKLLQGGLASHVSLEKLLHDMGERTRLEEVREFAEIFTITKRNGGSLAGVIRMTAQEISGRMLLEEEMRTALASKRLEQKIMNVIPFLLVLYLELTTPGYFDIFFRDFSGMALMTGFLIWYIAAYGLSEYILWKLTG